MTTPDAADEKLKIGIVQMNSGSDFEANCEKLTQFIKAAAGDGACYVQTPENSLLMELDKTRVEAIADSENYAQALGSIGKLAGELQIYIHLGSAATLLNDGRNPKLANRSYLFGPDGNLVSFYDKIHMFDAELPQGESYRESASYRAGEKAVVTDCGFANVGLTICYDLRFPRLFRSLASAGAEIICVPAAFTRQTGAAHWHILLRARAIETGSFIIASAQTGRHDNGRETFGHSLIVGPWGNVLVDGGTAPSYYCAEIELAEIEAARSAIPALYSDQTFKPA